jgi:hypothetical protein
MTFFKNMEGVYCRCFICMLRMFAMVLKCSQVFLQMFQTHVTCVSSVFFRILQLLHLNVSKVYQMLHI